MSMLRSESFRSSLLWALLPMALSTVCLGAVEVAVQQSYRMPADDPQIQMAQDAASNNALAKAAVAALRERYPGVDIARSLAPWLAVYDSRGVLIDSSAKLDGYGPVPPAGVFASAAASGEDRITWQPRPGVRAAIVVRETSDHGFVVAGRSLREVEKRESNLMRMMTIAWGFAIAVCGVAAFLRL